MNAAWTQVKQLFERAVRTSPSDALTRADYGRFLAFVENNLSGALENLREAIRCDPDWWVTVRNNNPHFSVCLDPRDVCVCGNSNVTGLQSWAALPLLASGMCPGPYKCGV